MIVNIGSRIIPSPLSRALKEKCLWMSYCESQINKTTTSAMRREERDVIILCVITSVLLVWNIIYCLNSRIGIGDESNKYSRLLFVFPVLPNSVREAPSVWLRWNSGPFSTWILLSSPLLSFYAGFRQFVVQKLDNAIQRIIHYPLA